MPVEPLSIKIYLPKGSATSLRTAEISNWSGKAVACARTELAELAGREESARPGVYILVGSDSKSGDPAAYIGEAEEVAKRLKQHLNKDFWSQVIAFVSKDENLTKAHIKYLEGRLIALGLEAGRGIILNGQSSGARLPEADQAEMDIFLGKMLKLLPVLGTHLFNPTTESVSRTKPNLYCRIKGLEAIGQPADNGFVVFQGSQAVKDHRKSAGPFAVLREKLFALGVLQPLGDHWVFSKDHEFSSPSLAAGVVCGGHMNGLTAWKTEDGKTLKVLEGGN